MGSNSVDKWGEWQIFDLLGIPFNDLIYRAHLQHRKFHNHNELQLSTLLSVKTGACPEDCKYCPQSIHYNSGVKRQRMLSVDESLRWAKLAQENGASRFCMGAAWRNPTQRNLDAVLRIISAVKTLGMETCATLGMLTLSQAKQLKATGLDYYNHNLDTSPRFYGQIISTRTYQDRIKTLNHVREAGLKVCCGGILGMGESREDRSGLLQQLSSLSPESVPINLLVRVENTPLHGTRDFDQLEFVRTVAAARIIMPRASVRLSAGREQMSDVMQAMCFFAGANSVFFGEKLLTTDNPETGKDKDLFRRLGLETRSSSMSG